MKDFNNLDGVIENFDAVNPINNVSKNYFDQDTFYPASGWVEHYDATNASNNVLRNYHDQDNFYPFLGEIGSTVNKISSGTILSKTERAKRRSQRQARKDAQTQGQLEAARGLAKAAEGDKELLKTLAPKKTSTKPTGLSLGAKIGIGVGIAAVLGIGAYFLLRKKK